VVAGALSSQLVGTASSAPARSIEVQLQPRVVEYQPARVSVSGIAAASVSVRLRGANDPAGLAYRWAPYRWQRLRLIRGRWRGVLPAPPLHGIYQLQLRLQKSRQLLQSPDWLLRALPPGTLKGPSFPTPRSVIRDFVRGLPGNPALVAARRWPRPAFDHRDPRLQRLFVIAYAPRRNDGRITRRGLFITTVRAGYHGRWRLLEAATAPYD
jgi:hypothetical protein